MKGRCYGGIGPRAHSGKQSLERSEALAGSHSRYAVLAHIAHQLSWRPPAASRDRGQEAWVGGRSGSDSLRARVAVVGRARA